MTHPCEKKCTEYKDEQCKTCLIPCNSSEKEICLSNFAKNETQTDLSIESGSQFEVGDYVVAKDTYNTNELFQLESYGFFGGMYDTKWRLLDLRQFRLATPAEIKAGYRIDTTSNTLETLEEVDLSPNCVVGGDK